MTKKDHKCGDCKKLLPNQVTIEWDFNTYELCIMIKPKQVLMTDISSPDRITKEEKAARDEFEKIRKRLLERYNEGL